MPPTVAAVIIAFQHGGSIVGQSEERRAAEEEYARSHLVSRDSVAGWRRVENPAAERQAEIAAAQLEDKQPGSSMVYGGYVNGTKAMSFTGTNTGPDSGLREELEVSPKHALVNHLAGAGISEPIPINTSIEGIEMMCADRPESTVICSWADLTTVGTTVWQYAGVDLDQARELTELFLEELRVVDEPPG